MRSLRSARKVPTKVSNKQDENATSKMCTDPTKSIKSRRTKRQVLADKTNSGSDMNQSNSSAEMDKKNESGPRPKRQINIPIRFINQDLSPVGCPKVTPRCASTPICTKSTKKKLPNPTPPSPLKIESPKRIRTRRGMKVVETVEKAKAVPTPQKTQPSENNVNVSKLKADPQKLSKTQNNVKPPTPIYRKTSLIEKPSIPEPERLALYEFQVDSREEPKIAKKKVAQKKSAPRRKKTAKTPIDDDAAMKVLVEQLKKIKAVAALKKLKKNNAVKNVKVEIPALNNVESVAKVIPRPIEPSPLISPVYERRTSYSSPAPSPIQNVSDDAAVFRCPAPSNTSTEPPQMSSFCDLPIASSSMIQNPDAKPSASPWRVNYEKETRKWPYNFIVKASMTPSYQRDTFHVMGLDDVADRSNTNRSEAPQSPIDESQQKQTETNKNWKQTSILSFYEESFKKSHSKKSNSPKKYYSQFNLDELIAKNRSMDETNSSQESSETSTDKGTSEKDADDVRLNKNKQLLRKENNKSNIEDCFGFDDSAYDQENVNPISPSKIKNINVIRRGGKQRKGRELKEINQPVVGPARVTTKDLINVIASHKKHIFEDLSVEEKSTENIEAEVVINNDDSSNEEPQDVIVPETSDVTNKQAAQGDVGLFEDPVEPELVHFSKPTRKSYERKKRPAVKFADVSNAEDDPQSSDIDSQDDDYEESTHETKKRSKRTKKKRKPNIKTLKQEKEVEQWAAGFNSMLEEADDFDLCIE